MPPHAFFCGPTAARLLKVPLPWHLEQSPLVHVAVPPGNRAPTGRTVRGHTLTIDPDDIRERDGLRISSPESTWCTLGATLGLAELIAAGDFLIHHRLPLSNRNALAAALDSFVGRRGLRQLRAALPLLDERSESPQESILRAIVILGGVQCVTANHPIRTSGGFRYRADLAIADRKFILEYQSRFHDGAKEFRADMTRISRLEADGWRVMQVNRDDLDDPQELLYRIRTALRARAKVR